jgi:hypothetical protein
MLLNIALFAQIGTEMFKAFRSCFRGVGNISFFLFRLSNIWISRNIWGDIGRRDAARDDFEAKILQIGPLLCSLAAA